MPPPDWQHVSTQRRVERGKPARVEIRVSLRAVYSGPTFNKVIAICDLHPTLYDAESGLPLEAVVEEEEEPPPWPVWVRLDLTAIGAPSHLLGLDACGRPGSPLTSTTSLATSSTSGGNSSGNNSVAGEEDAPLTSLNFTAALTSRSPESRQKATIRWARAYRQKRRERAATDRIEDNANRVQVVAEIAADREYKRQLAPEPKAKQRAVEVAEQMAAAAKAMIAAQQERKAALEAKVEEAEPPRIRRRLPSTLPSTRNEGLRTIALRLRLPDSSIIEAMAEDNATVGELLVFTESVWWEQCIGTPREDDEDAVEAFSRRFALTLHGREIYEAEEMPTLRSAGLVDRCALVIQSRDELAPKRGDRSSMPEAWRSKRALPQAFQAAPTEPPPPLEHPSYGKGDLLDRDTAMRERGLENPDEMAIAPYDPKHSQDASRHQGHPNVIQGSSFDGGTFEFHIPKGLEGLFSELQRGAAAAMRTQGVALALPGNRLVGVLHGAYTFDETSFVKSGMLVILVAPDEGSDDHLHGEELLGQLQPTLHFQSLGFVLPDRQKRGGKSTIESWADDVAEILKFLHDTQQQMEVRGIVAHGKAAEACLLHANRTAMIAAAEAEAEAIQSRLRRRRR